jgi:hypothetical protein
MVEGVEHPVQYEANGVMFLKQMKMAARIGQHALHNIMHGHHITQIPLVVFKERHFV